MEDNTQAVLDLIRSTVREHEPNAEIILYGSRARGDARPDSDWDILVLVDNPQFNYKRSGDLTYNVWFKGMENNVDIDAFAYSKSQWEKSPLLPFKYNVMHEGIKI